MSAEGQSSLPPGAVKSFPVPPKVALVRDGRLQLGEPRSLSDEALERILVLAVSAALEATTMALRRSIEREEGITSEDERVFHNAVIETMDTLRRDEQFIRSAVQVATALLGQSVRRGSSATA